MALSMLSIDFLQQRWDNNDPERKDWMFQLSQISISQSSISQSSNQERTGSNLPVSFSDAA
jgi:hypothetical protein